VPSGVLKPNMRLCVCAQPRLRRGRLRVERRRVSIGRIRRPSRRTSRARCSPSIDAVAEIAQAGGATGTPTRPRPLGSSRRRRSSRRPRSAGTAALEPRKTGCCDRRDARSRRQLTLEPSHVRRAEGSAGMSGFGSRARTAGRRAADAADAAGNCPGERAVVHLRSDARNERARSSTTPPKPSRRNPDSGRARCGMPHTRVAQAPGPQQPQHV
jgi:hypothetical protein